MYFEIKVKFAKDFYLSVALKYNYFNYSIFSRNDSLLCVISSDSYFLHLEKNRIKLRVYCYI